MPRAAPSSGIPLAIALLVALPGCLSGSTTDGGAGTVAPAMPARGAFVDPIPEGGSGHDHADPAAHNFSTPNMELLAFNVLSGEETAFSYIGEVDVHGDLAVVQVIGRGSTPGFVLVNVSDPRAPVVVGRAEMPYSYVVDVKFSPDGTRVFAASQAGTGRAPLVPSGPGLAYGARNGIATWDVRDPAKPILESVVPLEPEGCHMLSAAHIPNPAARGNGVYVFCVNADIVVLEVNLDGGAWKLVPVGSYSPQSPTGVDETVRSREAAPGPLPHDMTFQRDPLDGKPVLFVSYWDWGLRVVDVSMPSAPRELGAWGGAGAGHYEGNVHGAMATAVDGKRYVVAGPELLSDNVPALYFLEAGSYGAMKLAAEWVPPGEHGAEGLLLTTHQFQLVDGRLYLAYNHAGVWVLDVRSVLNGTASDPDRPEVLGYYLPHEAVKVYDEKVAKVPDTWDIVVRKGAIYATDRYTGLYVLHYVPDGLGNETLSSFA